VPRAVFIAILAAAFFGSFFATLWLTEPSQNPAKPPAAADSRPIPEQFAGRHVANRADLTAAAQQVGLRPSTTMRGALDSVTRVAGGDAVISGWFADPQGDATPLNVLVFAGGSLAASSKTSGERPDVTQALGLSFGSEKNVKMAVQFHCTAGDMPLVMSVSAGNQYLVLESKPCP